MLHVRMLSGEAVTSILVEEMDDVEALKQRLTQLHGFPPRFRQRVLQRRDLGGRSEAGLPQDLGPHSAQVEELAAAATQGSVSEVGRVGKSIPTLNTSLTQVSCMCIL